MAMTEEAQKVADFCSEHLRLEGARLANAYFYQSLPLCVIDAVYSISVRYEGVQNVVKRYCDYFGLREIRQSRDRLPLPSEQQPLTALIEAMEKLGIEKFTRDVFKNSQRTSSRSGILKSEAVLRFAIVLHEHGIRFLEDVPAIILNTGLDSQLRQIPGQSSGISIGYFFMLAGNESLIKPDRHILSFLQRCLNRVTSPVEAQWLLSATCNILRGEHRSLTPRLLDYLIWNYERGRK